MLNLKNIHISWALEVGGVRIDSLLQQEQLNCYMIVVAAGILGRAAVACRRRARGRGRARLGGATRVPKESIQGHSVGCGGSWWGLGPEVGGVPTGPERPCRT